MAKKLKQIMVTNPAVTSVKSGKEKEFVRMHTVQKTLDANGNDDKMFNASNIQPATRKGGGAAPVKDTSPYMQAEQMGGGSLADLGKSFGRSRSRSILGGEHGSSSSALTAKPASSLGGTVSRLGKAVAKKVGKTLLGNETEQTGNQIDETQKPTLSAYQKKTMKDPDAKHRNDPSKWHQRKVARGSLKMPDEMLGVMGGPSKAEAKKILKKEETELDEARYATPIKGHPYHEKSDAELHYIMKDAHAASKAVRGHDDKAEGKYLDQVNDAATVLAHRRRHPDAGYKPNAPKSIKKEETINEGYPTRKHFKQVAEVVKMIKDPADRERVAHHHAEVFSKQNPRFDRKRFLDAAGCKGTHCEKNEETLDEISNKTKKQYLNKIGNVERQSQKAGSFYWSSHHHPKEVAAAKTKHEKHVATARKFFKSGKFETIKKEETQLDETITKDTPCKDVIHDFVHSKNKKFSDDSKKQRIKRALGACYSKKNEDVDLKKKVTEAYDPVTGAFVPDAYDRMWAQQNFAQPSIARNIVGGAAAGLAGAWAINRQRKKELRASETPRDTEGREHKTLGKSGAITGAVIGGYIAGVPGAIAGAGIGGAFGNSIRQDISTLIRRLRDRALAKRTNEEEESLDEIQIAIPHTTLGRQVQKYLAKQAKKHPERPHVELFWKGKKKDLTESLPNEIGEYIAERNRHLRRATEHYHDAMNKDIPVPNERSLFQSYHLTVCHQHEDVADKLNNLINTVNYLEFKQPTVQPSNKLNNLINTVNYLEYKHPYTKLSKTVGIAPIYGKNSMPVADVKKHWRE